jgi:hypothetical protein
VWGGGEGKVLSKLRRVFGPESAASAGQYDAMHHLRIWFGKGFVSRESIDSTLTAYNNSCAEMRGKARDDYIRAVTKEFKHRNRR